MRRRALDIADVRGGRLSEAARALERDESIEGRTSGQDSLGDDTWLQRHSQTEVAHLLILTVLLGSHQQTLQDPHIWMEQGCSHKDH